MNDAGSQESGKVSLSNRAFTVHIRAKPSNELFGTVAKWELLNYSNRVHVTAWIEENPSRIIGQQIKLEKVLDSPELLQFGCYEDLPDDGVRIGMKLGMEKISMTRKVEFDKNQVRRVLVDFDTTLDKEVRFNEDFTLAGLKFPTAKQSLQFFLKMRVTPVSMPGK